MESFQIVGVSGTAARIGEQVIDRDGNDAFDLSAVITGVSTITASVPGPADAPGKSLALTVTVEH